MEMSIKQPNETCLSDIQPIFEAGIDLQEEEVLDESETLNESAGLDELEDLSESNSADGDNTNFSNNNRVDASVQCDPCDYVPTRRSIFSINKFKTDNRRVRFYTGFADFSYFNFFFKCLGPAVVPVDELNYQCGSQLVQDQLSSLTVEDRLFLTLIKLRQDMEDCELALLFSVDEETVRTIFITWINFMYFQLGESDVIKKAFSETMPNNVNAEVVHGRRLALNKIHLERIKHLRKTFKLLRKGFNDSDVQFGSIVVFVCFALTLFHTKGVPLLNGRPPIFEMLNRN